ncbi:hypothetical protein [Rhizobium leguminosarum]|uniref:hypothetical protein n=1 Tax=Rhizobium leguminosarum TaxID=384 RepID=UPI000407494A|nr:hypothetical protein [Rhizobium leguminosarum]
MSGDDNFLVLVLFNTLGIAGIGNRPTGRLIVQIPFFTSVLSCLLWQALRRTSPMVSHAFKDCLRAESAREEMIDER